MLECYTRNKHAQALGDLYSFNLVPAELVSWHLSVLLMMWFVSWFGSTPATIQILPVLPAAAEGCHCGLLILSRPFSSFPLQHVDSLSNKKQMGDLCCRLLPNGANSHYSVCKLCLFCSSFTSTPCTILPSDVFNTCFRCRCVILMGLV